MSLESVPGRKRKPQHARPGGDPDRPDGARDHISNPQKTLLSPCIPLAVRFSEVHGPADIVLRLKLSLSDVYTGKTVEANIKRQTR
jgi:hypothetical protein